MWAKTPQNKYPSNRNQEIPKQQKPLLFLTHSRFNVTMPVNFPNSKEALLCH